MLLYRGFPVFVLCTCYAKHCTWPCTVYTRWTVCGRGYIANRADEQITVVKQTQRLTGRKTDRQRDRQASRQRQTDGQTDRQRDEQTNDRQTHSVETPTLMKLALM